MNKLNLKKINLQAPYTVHEREDKQHEFYFWSDFGIVYDINFTPLLVWLQLDWLDDENLLKFKKILDALEV